MNCPTSNTTDETDTAFSRALYFLKFRPRSRYEIQKYLKDKNFCPETVTNTIRRLEAAGYLNDGDFARLWVENRLRCKPKGMAALKAELRAKGISEEIIHSVLADLDEKQAAWDAISPKLRHWNNLEKEEFKKKVYGCLTRRGFHYELCREIFEKAWKDVNSSPL
jgi:regulatory protein